MWKMAKEDALAGFKYVCPEMKRANDEKAPLTNTRGQARGVVVEQP